MESDIGIGFGAVRIPEKLQFLGRELNFSKAYFQYAAARNAFEPEADRAIRRMKSTFDDRIGYLDNFVSDGKDYIIEILDPLLDFTMEQLASNGCYSLSKGDFLENYVDNKISDIEEIHEEMTRAYNEIQERQRKKNEERVRERKEAVAAGKDELGAMLWNGLKRAADGGMNVARAVSVYTDDLKKRIKDEISMLCETMVDSFTEALFDNENIDFRDPVSVEDYKRVRAILNNLEKGNIPESKIDAAAFEALSKCPCMPGLFDWLLEHYGDGSGDLQQIADAFDYPLEDVKEGVISRFWDDLDFRTEEAALASRDRFLEFERRMNFHSDEHHDDMERIIRDFDLKARTADGIEYKTREEAEKARTLFEMYGKIDRSSMEGMLNGRDEFLDLEKTLDFRIERYEKELDSLIGEADLKFRTVNGVEYRTLEEAKEMRRQHAALMNIIKANGIDSAEHTQNIIDNIDQNAYTIPLAARCRERLICRLEMLKKRPGFSLYKFIMSIPGKIVTFLLLISIGGMLQLGEIAVLVIMAFVVYICINTKKKFFGKMERAIEKGKYRDAAIFYDLAKPSADAYLHIDSGAGK